MNWIAVLSVSTLIGALVFGLLLGAFCAGLVAALRKRVDENAARQAQACRHLADGVARLQRQLDESRARIEALSQANRRLTDEIDAMGERLSDTGPAAAQNRARLLH
ncbi:MAG TPA: hypothetical protein VED40_14220 [Azospirillaceae bacterium]|nr:hypothetical protein [Azospirillaceae bacterium]